ncbi:MAG: substrate-binding domain-containing protein [Candidatus Krumholzibacteriia bacterium]
MASKRRTWFLVRVAVYLAVITGLLLWRGGVDWRARLRELRGAPAGEAVLTVSGRDLAPALVDRLLALYLQDYPHISIATAGGGTNHALEDLVNGRADVALLYRQPTAAEQDLFRAASGDTALVFPVAVAAAVLLAGARAPADSLALDELRAALAGQAPAPWARFYAPDPNDGLWDAVRSRLELPADVADALPVTWLADGPAVAAAVAADDSAWGLVSTFGVPTDSLGLPLTAARTVHLRAEADAAAAAPSRAAVAAGDYPLHHRLLAACAAGGNFEGAKFVTHLASGRGQRQVERAGALPARQVAREVYLTRQPVGKGTVD